MEHNADQAQAKRSQVPGLHIVSVSGSHFMSLLEKKTNCFLNKKYIIKQTENSIKEVLTSGKKNLVSDEIQKKNTQLVHEKYEIPEGHCQSSEPHFLCDEIKKNIFFSHRPVSSKMRFQKDTTSAKSLNLIICAQMLLNTSSFFFINKFSLR